MDWRDKAACLTVDGWAGEHLLTQLLRSGLFAGPGDDLGQRGRDERLVTA